MDVVSTILLFIPVLLVLWLANLSHRRRIEGDVRNERTLKLLSYGLLFLLYAFRMFLGLGLLGVGLVGVFAPQVFDAQSLTASGFPADRLPWMGGSLVVFSLLGLLLLTRPARRLFARFIPIDPTHPVHAVALSLTASVLINLAFTVAIGLDNLANMIQTSGQAGPQANPAPALWAQNIMFLLMGLVGVGFAARRSLRAALIRLGIVAPTVRQVIVAVVVGLLMVPLVIGAEALATKLGAGTSSGVERLTEQLVGPLTQSVFGILTLGLAAALGEETVFRGALLPRFGLVFTSLLFALLHSQYGLSFSTIAVFVVGLVLGTIRLRANTTSSMITHAVYNMSLGLITYLGLMQNH